jgi:hypothetical protein
MQLGPAVKRYLDVRLAEGAARESIRKELTTLRAALREAVALGWMTKAQSIDAIPDFTARYKPRTRWLKRDEYAKLLDALEMVELPAGKSKRAQKLVKPSPRLGLRVVNRRLWVAIAVGLGARRSEVESLDWAGIDLDAGILANHGTKTKGSNRATPIPVELLVELRKIPEASRVGRVGRRVAERRPRPPEGVHARRHREGHAERPAPDLRELARQPGGGGQEARHRGRRGDLAGARRRFEPIEERREAQAMMACKAEEGYTRERCSLSKQSSRTVASWWMSRPSCRMAPRSSCFPSMMISIRRSGLNCFKPSTTVSETSSRATTRTASTSSPR